MGKQAMFKVQKNEVIAPGVHRLVLKGDTSACTAPGQFVNILMKDVYLRRPISICEYDDQTVTLVFRRLGKGTEILAARKPGDELNALVGMGNGYTVPEGISRPLVVGGGLGTPPLYALSKLLIEKGKAPIVLLGFRTANDVFYDDRFQLLGCRVIVCTDDGTRGEQGIAALYAKNLEGQYDYYYACGPVQMLRTLYDTCPTDGQMSFEERMGCGFGACMGCTCKTKFGNKRICVDGPVLSKGEIIWQN